jgi:feruloyl esterase
MPALTETPLKSIGTTKDELETKRLKQDDHAAWADTSLGISKRSPSDRAVEGTDVVADGVVDDPRQCKYTAEGDPTILAAPAGTCTGANCVTLLQAKAIYNMWEDASLSGGPHNHFGAKNWYGLMPTIHSPSGGIGPTVGTGSTNPERIYDWDHRDVTGNVQNLYSTRLFAAANPFGEPSPIAMEDELQLNESPLSPPQTTNGATASTGSYFQNNDYEGIVDQHFRAKHVKIIHWSGANDTNVWFPAQVRFYRATATALGYGHADYAGLSSWYRYYHAPGVGHCGGDVGASPTLTIAPDGQAQMFTDLVNWVEKGIVPQSAGDSTHEGILATGPGSFGTRPICPYPTTAIYNGTGSMAVASNYHCGGNLDTPVTLCQLPITRYGQATSNVLNYEEVDVSPKMCEK